jgi:hypothetical protein
MVFKLILSFFISISLVQDQEIKFLLNEIILWISLTVILIEMILKFNLGFYYRG